MKNKLDKVNKIKDLEIEINSNFQEGALESIFDLYKNDFKYDEKEKMQIKKEIENIADIVTFMYQTPQAKEANENGMISEFDAEELGPKIEKEVGTIDQLHLEPIDVISIYDNYSGDFGIVKINKGKKIVEIHNFINEVWDNKGNHDTRFSLEMYNDDGQWCEAHFNYDEEDEDYKLFIDEIPADQKIKETRDISYTSYGVKTKEELQKVLYNYFNINEK